MAPLEIEPALHEQSGSLVLSNADESDRRFANLRGVRWRVNLGVLPSFDSSIDEFRRAAANSRRRRRLLINPHVLKDKYKSLNFITDDPLSQSPNSTWGQIFRISELAKTLDQDLSRLYQEHYCCYFQTPGCQGMLRRILLLWCLKHPEYGYRQGMHELLAPLLYVLHVDIMRLSEVRKDYEDYFTDRFDSLSSEERDITYTYDFNKFMDSMDDGIGSQGFSKKIKSLDELDPEVQSIVMLSDSYGTESELGSVLSEKFMEHDAYCMFDALMSGTDGCVAMASFFSYSPTSRSHTGLTPVLEACTALFRLLDVVDSSLHSHLVELGVEPQYFGLRWLRVLFGREFLLEDLLLVWDEIFSAGSSAETDTTDEDSRNHSFGIVDCPRGTLILGMAVSMILYLRSTLLSSENATCCLQRLLNFPEITDLNKIIQKAKLLQVLVLDTDVRSALSINCDFDQRSYVHARTKSFPSGSTSPSSPLIFAPESYSEKKWRVLHKAKEEERQNVLEKQSPPTQKKRMWLKVTKIFRAVTNLSLHKAGNGEKEANSSSPVTRSLLEDLSQQLLPELEEANSIDCLVTMNKEDNSPQETEEDIMDFHSADEESIISGNSHSEENASIYSDPISPIIGSNYLENGSDSITGSNLFPDKSIGSPVSSEPISPAIDLNYCGNDLNCSTGSNLFLDDENYEDPQTSGNSPVSISPCPDNEYPVTQSDEDDPTDKYVGITKEHKLLHGIVQWFRKFKRTFYSEEKIDINASDATKTNNVEIEKNQISCYSEFHPQASSSGQNRDSDQNLLKTLKNLGQSMLKHIQVIELVFQQQPGIVQAGMVGNLAKTNLIGRGQVTATTALMELRKISNLLLDM
ncbi:PREDICTED: TBC1 domain family member 5 homolog A-like isoform X2 [Camelina sativa]|uniref:TBC1 domain family member 5 homolog A-like isoform X2 n=1 Tax=Camelina sativa TaxID=90675 RepID=A0ABM0SRN8_CAMSA|nr:PREDICTED: TBC1 domain family member 5 homolog A-like isoform X2 [Camelina sativa]